MFMSALVCVVIALAGPRWGTKLVQRPSRSRDLLVVLDCSRSMLATDVSPSRLKHAKWFIRELIERTPGDRYGLIAFSGTAFLECPLTQDRSGILLFLDDMNTDTIPVGGTNIEEALRTALAAFKAAEGSHRAIILITDGDELQGDSRTMLDDLKERNIPIFAVGIGDPTLGSFIQTEGNKFITDKNGNRVNTKLNEASLQRIAEAVGGTYVHSTVVHDGIDHITGRVKGLIPEQQEDNTISKPIERYQIPLLFGLICLLIRTFLGERKAQGTLQLSPSQLGVASLSIVVVQFVCFYMSWYGVTASSYAQEEERVTNRDTSTSVDSRANNSVLTKPQFDLPAPEANVPITPSPIASQRPMDTSGIGEKKLVLIKKSIQSLEEKIGNVKDPIELGYFHYNLGVNYQLLGQKDRAEMEYNKALDAQSESDDLAALAYLNLGVLKHSEARRNLAANPDLALNNLNETQEYYREAMRIDPTLEGVAKNQEMVLRERRLIGEFKQIQEQINNLQKNAQEAAKDAHKAQQATNQEQVSTAKEQKQYDAFNKTQKAQKAASRLEEAAKDLGQKNVAEWLDQAKKILESAIEEQKKVLTSLSEGEEENNAAGKRAEELISQALRQLGGKIDDKKEEGNQTQPQEKIVGQKQEEEGETSSQDNDQEGETAFDPTDEVAQDDLGKERDNQEQFQDFDNLQALRILDDLQQHEKDLKQEMKKTQKKNRRAKEVEKNW